MQAISSATQVQMASATHPQPRLVRAAHEFEGLMMKELLKPMLDTNGLTGDDSDSDSDAGSGGALGEFASEMLGQALSRQGGFGIADRIIHSLSHSGATHGSRIAMGKERASLKSESVNDSSD